MEGNGKGAQKLARRLMHCTAALHKKMEQLVRRTAWTRRPASLTARQDSQQCKKGKDLQHSAFLQLQMGGLQLFAHA